MTEQEAKAQIVLFDQKRRDALCAAIKPSGIRFELFDYVISGVTGLGVFCVANHYANIPTSSVWDVIVACMAVASVFGAIRLRRDARLMERRFDALVRLLEIERNEHVQLVAGGHSPEAGRNASA